MGLLPQGKELIVFLLCLLVGGYVIIRFCLDQFDRPSNSSDENDPWRFLVTRFLTPRQQYLTGFTAYCGIMLAIFLLVSLFPGAISDVLKAVAAAATGDIRAEAATVSKTTLQNYPTFPILVAFYIVGLNPNLPKMLDFEIIIRRLGHRLAYIPKNVDKIFNFMRFSEFDLSEQQLQRAWDAVDLRRNMLDAPDGRPFATNLNKAVVLYARAGLLAGDITMEGETDLPDNVNLEVFKQYRGELQNVGANLQAINARLAEQVGVAAADRRRSLQMLQRDLVKNLELLYVIFASATATKGVERLSNRLRAIGFTSMYPPPPGIPWDPLLKVMGAAALVMFAACVIAAATFEDDSQQNLIPTTPGGIAYLLAALVATYLVAIWQALSLRARLIGLDQYLYDAGQTRAVAFLKIFARSGICAWLVHLAIYSPDFVRALASADGNGLSSPQILTLFLKSSLGSLLITGACGLMTACTLDRPSDSTNDRFWSGILQGGSMAVAALVTAHLIITKPPIGYQIFVVVLYGGLGFVLGFLLPAAIRRHWRAQADRLPEKIGQLRASVLQYFRDFQDFMEWMGARNARLGGKRPMDVLAEEAGLQQLTSLVTNTRPKITPAT